MHSEISLLSCSVFIKNRMIKKGFNRISDILNTDKIELTKTLKLPFHQLDEIITECSFLINTRNSLNNYQEIECIATESYDVNSLLNGGLKTQAIYEFLGLPSTGKSTFAINSAFS